MSGKENTGFDAVSAVRAVNAAAGRRIAGKQTILGADGLYRCAVCGEPVQCRISIGGVEQTVWACCKCDTAERDRMEAELRRQALERRRLASFGGSSGYTECTFVADDSPESRLSRIARAYAGKLCPESDWLLLCGGNGVGKTFYAAAICNAVIDRGMTARFTSISEIERERWSAADRSEALKEYFRCSLLVIDDLGSERESGYMNEIAFDVLDGRLRSGLPCIITTNKQVGEIMECRSADMKRIYSRVAERSVPVACTGEDRRRKAMLSCGAERLKRLLEE